MGPPATVVGGDPMRAFVLSGGGTLGAWQVGQLEGLLDGGVEPDLLVGTSVGAMNAAAVAGDPTPEGVRNLATTWRRTRRADILPVWGWSRVSALSRRALYSNGGLLYSAWLMLRPPADALAGSYGAFVKVVVLPSCCPIALRPFDFSQTDRLIGSAREQTAAFLEGAEVPA